MPVTRNREAGSPKPGALALIRRASPELARRAWPTDSARRVPIDNGGQWWYGRTMQITGVTPEQFADVVAKVSATSYQNNLRPEIGSQQSATRFRGRVMLQHTGYQLFGRKDTSLLAPGQRRSASSFSNGRRINAVCWHVYRDVLSELFNQFPDARVYTALAKYKGKDGFEANYPATGRQNIGSMAYPMTMPETCDCEY